jgi:galactose mutarotase-like enzyme
MRIIQNQYLKVSVNDIGGELTSVVDKNTGREYMHDADPKWWNGISPVLFPVVGRFFKKTYTDRGNTYQLPLHGFVHGNPMEFVTATDTSVTHRRVSDDITRAMYPYDFEFYITHTLEGKSLNVTYKVVNTGDADMPFQVGAHPGFKAELGDKLILKGKDNLTFQYLDNGLVSNQKHPIGRETVVTKELFDNDVLIFDNAQLYAAALADSDGEYIEVSFTGFPACGIWAVAGAPYVCLEPWYGADDVIGTDNEFSHRNGMNHLTPKNTFTATYTINPRI